MQTFTRSVTNDEMRNADEVQSLKPRLESMSDWDLWHLREDPVTNSTLSRWMGNWPFFIKATTSFGASAATVAITQPLAKWMGITDKKFGAYMKHPAALAVMGAGFGTGMIEFQMLKHDFNEQVGLRMIDTILTRRGVDLPRDPDTFSELLQPPAIPLPKIDLTDAQRQALKEIQAVNQR